MMQKAAAADANPVYECYTIKSAGCPEGVGGLQGYYLVRISFPFFV